MAKKISIPVFICVVTLAHVFSTNTSNTGIAYLAFFIYPLLTALQAVFKLTRLKKALPAIHLSIMVWSLFAVLWHTLYLHWALTEILFIAMVVYAETFVTRKNLYARFFKGGVLWLAGLVAVHTVLNSASGEYSYGHPSGSIMTFGILGLLFLSYFSIEENEQKQNTKIDSAERLSKSLTNLLLSIGHALRTPLTTLKLKAEILKLKEEQSALSGDISEEIDAIIQLFERFEKALLLECSELTIETLVNSLEADITVEIVPNEAPTRTTALQLRYLSTIMNILADNALEHGAGEQRLQCSTRDGLIRFSVENQGAYFNPKEFLNSTGTYRPDVSLNNRIGVSLTTTYSLAEAIGYTISFEPREEGGTIIFVAPDPEFHPISKSSLFQSAQLFS